VKHIYLVKCIAVILVVTSYFFGMVCWYWFVIRMCKACMAYYGLYGFY
jgi:hypothetical protein